MSPSSKNAKNIKIQDQIRLKIIKWNICIMRFQITDKQVVICPQEEEKKKKKKKPSWIYFYLKALFY